MTRSHAIEAYGRRSRPGLGPRAAEAHAFAKAARLLEDARHATGDRAMRAQALRFNRLIWTILQAELSAPGNGLPSMLRADLISLSLYVDRQTATALADSDPRHLVPLIEIARAVAQGQLGTRSLSAN